MNAIVQNREAGFRDLVRMNPVIAVNNLLSYATGEQHLHLRLLSFKERRPQEQAARNGWSWLRSIQHLDGFLRIMEEEEMKELDYIKDLANQVYRDYNNRKELLTLFRKHRASDEGFISPSISIFAGLMLLMRWNIAFSFGDNVYVTNEIVPKPLSSPSREFQAKIQKVRNVRDGAVVIQDRLRGCIASAFAFMGIALSVLAGIFKKGEEGWLARSLVALETVSYLFLLLSLVAVRLVEEPSLLWLLLRGQKLLTNVDNLAKALKVSKEDLLIYASQPETNIGHWFGKDSCTIRGSNGAGISLRGEVDLELANKMGYIITDQAYYDTLGEDRVRPVSRKGDGVLHLQSFGELAKQVTGICDFPSGTFVGATT